MVRALAVAVVLLIGGLLAPSSARADAEADALIERGLDLRAAKKDAEALALFEQAHARSPSPRALAQIGLAEQALERWLSAERHLGEALAAKKDPWIAARKATLEASLAAIDKRLARLELSSNAEGATAKVEGAEGGALPRTVRVVAGKVKLEVRAPGYTTAGKTIDVAAGATEKVVVTLAKPAPVAAAPKNEGAGPSKAKDDPPKVAPKPAPPPDDGPHPGAVARAPDTSSGAPDPALRTWAWVSAGSGGGLLLIGVVLVAAAEESDTDCVIYDDFSYSCANPAQSAGIAMLVTAGLLGATAGVLFALSSDGGATTAALPTSCDFGLAGIAGPGARGASCAWRF